MIFLSVLKRTVVLVLITVLSFSDLATYFNVPQLPGIEKAEAIAGDFSVYRNNAANTSVPNGGTEVEIPWDTIVTETSGIELQSGSTTIDLSEGGKYLVLYNAWAEETGSGGENRRSFESYLTLDEGSGDTALAYGRGAGYIRDQNGDDNNAYTNGAAIIDADAGADLKINISRDDANTDNQTQLRAGTNGASVLKLKDDFDYALIPKTSNSGNISGVTTFTDVTWDSANELDTGSFSYTGGTADITLKGDEGDYFLVTYNVRLEQNAGSGERQNYESRLTLGGVEIPGTRVSAYVRGNSNSNGTYYGTLAYAGLVRKASSSNETLNVEVRQENTDDGSPPSTIIVGNETAFSAAALPAGAHYISLTSTSSQAVPNTQAPVDFDEQIDVETSAFSHSTTTNASRINIDLDGDYLFFSNIYAERSSASGDRDPYRVEWRLDGSNTLGYGGHGSFLRGDQGSQDSFAAGSAGGIIIPALTDTQYLEVTMYDEEDNADANLNAGMIALQGVELSLLFVTDVDVSASGTHQTSVSIPETEQYQGGVFAIVDNTGSRSVNNIIISESGTVDGSTGIDNIELYYDLDTTFPYNCDSESFSGVATESQFGTTDTSGFSGPDGVSSFSGSVSISTTQTMCVYVVYDVTGSASDGETLQISIADPTTDIGVSGVASVGPGTAVAPTGQTTLANPELTQIHYHWREDDGSESGASSVDDAEDTPAGGFQVGTQRRLRIEVSAEGSADADPAQFRLQFAEKSGTCAASSGWEDVADEGGEWDIGDSSFVAFGDNTTNIASAALGAVSDEESNFHGTSTLVDGGDKTLDVQIDGDEFAELEYTLISTSEASEGTTYCFRLVDESPDVTHNYRVPLVIQSSEVASDLTDFPVYVDLSTLGPHFFSNVTSDGGDIRVTTADGATEIAREVVSINTGSNTGELHFHAPNVSSSANTTFYVYYGASAENEYQASSTYGTHNVWNNGYEAVYHLPTTTDSTGNGFTLTESNITNSATTKVGTEAADFNGNTSVYTYSDPVTMLSGHGAFTFSAWIDSDITSTDKGFMIAPTINGSDAGVCARYDISGATGGGSNVIKGCIDTSGGAAQYETVSSVQTTAWQYITQTWQSTQVLDVYLDGVYTFLTATPTAQTGTTQVGSGNLYIGAGGKDTASGGWDGRIDEVRFASAYRNSSWIAAEYSNQNTPTTFYATSSYETLSNTPVSVTYDVYPEANITADILVSASSSQVANLDVGTTDQYVGGTFVIERSGANRTLTDITFTEIGSVDATLLSNPTLYYDIGAGSCTGESYAITDSSVSGTAFSGPNGSTTFSSINEVLSSSATFCGYIVFDISSSATNSDTINIEITNPSSDVVVTSSSVGPSTAISPTGSTTILGPVVTQTGYHWRNDDDTEADATSATSDVENTPILDVPRNTPYRLRYQLSNEGTVDTVSSQYTLEYGTKGASCDEVSNWQGIETGVAFTMGSTSQLIEGNDTTDVTTGAVSNPPGKTFLSSNGGQREETDTTAGFTLTSTQFVELEYAVEATDLSGYETTYCFRITNNGIPLLAYEEYAELTTRERQDFFIQRGTVYVTGTSTTLVAGVHYTAPAATSSAFIRLTGSQITGAGHSVQGTQDAINVTAYIEDQTDITSEVVIARPTSAANSTRVDWEIVEYVGIPGADNEMIVRSVGAVTYGTTALTATGSVVSTVSDDTDVVVFITGQVHPSAAATAYLGNLSTSRFATSTDEPVFDRETSSGGASGVSYAVVEFTGLNWQIQRIEHNYINNALTETEDIETVSSISRTFLHTQKRAGDVADNGLNDYGQQVWLSSIGSISFLIDTTNGGSGVGDPTEHYAVVWVIENTQTGEGAMQVHQISGSVDQNEAVEPRVTSVPIGVTLGNITNASLSINNESTGDGTAFPRAMLGATIASTTHFELFESDAGQTQEYRVEIIEWPVARTGIRQNYYRFYVDNDQITPTDPWPVGVSDLGENTSITGADDPLGEGDRLRLRMTLRISNVSMPAETETFKLQFGKRDTSCSAISSWTDLGDPGSGAIWRGYNTSVADGTEVATSTPAPGTLLIDSVADVAGTFEEQNNSVVNPYAVDVGEDVEYDWVVEHNGAVQLSDYCFRMIKSDDSALDGYNYYPTLRTTGYTPVIDNWRWYDDATSTTPLWHMANENVAPIDVVQNNEIKLRLTAAEVEGAPGVNVKFKLQYSEQSDFSGGVHDVLSTSTCASQATTTAGIWCYADGAGIDNAVIDSALLTDADSCTGGSGDGCGTHNETPSTPSTHNQPSLSNMEFEFTLRNDGARSNAVYYFRLYDVTNDVPIVASSSYPSLVTAGSELSFTVYGLNAGSSSEGVTADVATTPTSIPYGSIPVNTDYEAIYRLNVDTNATQGYHMYMYATQDLLNSYGEPIPSISSTNDSPLGWATACAAEAIGCFGYHTGDDTLSGGSTRFAADDSYAAISTTTPDEIMFSSVPTNDTVDVVFRVKVSDLQPAGDYESEIVYLVVPTF